MKIVATCYCNLRKSIKYQGIAETIAYTDKKNDRKYMEFIAKGNLHAALDMIRASAKENGYEFFSSENGKEGVWIHPTTNQIKSGDAITYDDNDNVIPISFRFDTQKNDIRYSIDETPESPDVSENKVEQLEAENKRLTEQVQRMQYDRFRRAVKDGEVSAKEQKQTLSKGADAVLDSIGVTDGRNRRELVRRMTELYARMAAKR